jgi:proteic killer suppression protein
MPGMWNNTGVARRSIPGELHRRAARLIDRIDAAISPTDFRVPVGNRLEKLAGKLEGYWSIRINDQYRIVFRWLGNEAVAVEICDYH